MRTRGAYLLAVVVLAGCGRLGYEPPGPTNVGLIAYWSFDSANLTADAVGMDDITCDTGACPSSGAGVLGGAAMFDGSNACGKVPTMDTWQSPSFTLSAWVKSSSMSGPLVVHESSSGCPSPAMETKGGSLGLVQLNTSNSTHNEAWTTSSIPNDGEWHQVAVSWDGTTQRDYVDGVCSCSTTPTRGPLDNPQPFTIGCYPGASTMFTGALDEVRVYDRALEPKEVAGLYAIGDRIPPKPQACPATCAGSAP